MPEGDTLYRAAARLQALTGQTLTELRGSHRSIRPWVRKLTGRRITSVENVGKHLLIHFDGGFSLRTHMQMTGVWHLYDRGERWRKTPGKARVVIGTGANLAVCFAAPDVEIGPTATILSSLERLGPDLTGDEFDHEEAMARMERSKAVTVSDLLLDQSVMAGVGNVFKSEILFLEKLHPEASPQNLDGQARHKLIRRARKLLLINRERVERNTTGVRGPSNRMWVYGRGRRPCRRCTTLVASGEIGDPARVTYWCPRCQAPELA